MPAPFIHLHCHTDYSLLDGACEITRLMDLVEREEMPAVAITDHGNLFGAVTFYEACRREGIRPILGVEAYVAPRGRHDRTHTGVSDGGYHLVLLAENIGGIGSPFLDTANMVLTFDGGADGNTSYFEFDFRAAGGQLNALAVPEPTTFTLAALVLLTFTYRRPRRHRPPSSQARHVAYDSA